MKKGMSSYSMKTDSPSPKLEYRFRYRKYDSEYVMDAVLVVAHSPLPRCGYFCQGRVTELREILSVRP